MEDESGLTGRVRATEAHVQKFESLDLLLGLDSREPLKIYEHGVTRSDLYWEGHRQ